MQRVHAHGVTRRLDGLAAPARGLKHAKLRLQLRGVPPESLERLANLVGVVALPALGQVLEARKRGERRLLSWFLNAAIAASPSERKYAGFIGQSGTGLGPVS